MSGLTAEEREALNRAQFLTPPSLEDNPVHQAVERIVADRERAAEVRALRLAQEAIAGEDTVEWARRAHKSTVSLSHAMELLDDLIEGGVQP